MTTLQETLLAPGTKPSVVADCMTLIQQEVKDMFGISGTAIKVAYKSVTTFAAVSGPGAAYRPNSNATRVRSTRP